MKALLSPLLLAACWTSCLTLSDKSDLFGPYCAKRTPSCCASRLDRCSVPILDGLCYCDDFCDRPDNDDCCPDYGFVCLNHTRPTPPPPPLEKQECQQDGQRHQQGSVFKNNCNTCKCEQVCRGGPFRTCRMEVSCDSAQCLVDPRQIAMVNNVTVDGWGWGWRAANYSQFWGRTLDEGLTKRLGTRHSKRRAYSMRALNPVFDRERVRAVVSFDPRQRRPLLVSPPLDQGWCADDWVVSTVQVATDRLMLVSQGEDRTTLSPQHLLSCNAKNQRGCAGGHITRAWKFIQKFGLVPDACFPWEGGRQTNCSVAKTKDRKRTMSRCSDGNSVMSLHRSGPAYRISREPESIMHEIQTSGPVQATMRVPPEFFSYRSGIFRCNATGRRTDSYHAVRVIGWGEELQQGQLVKYWIVSNSWGTWWGEGGYFRIVRGINECEIESLVLGAWLNPILPKKDPSITMMDQSNLMSNSLA